MGYYTPDGSFNIDPPSEGCGGFFVVIFVTGIIVLGLSIWHGSWQCGNYQKISGKETMYEPFDSCYVNTEAGWQRWDEYKARAIASDGLKGGGDDNRR